MGVFAKPTFLALEEVLISKYRSSGTITSIAKLNAGQMFLLIYDNHAGGHLTCRFFTKQYKSDG